MGAAAPRTVPKVCLSMRASAGVRHRGPAAPGAAEGSGVSKERSQKRGTSGKSINEWSAGGSSAFQAAQAVFKKESGSQKACENKSCGVRPPPALLRGNGRGSEAAGDAAGAEGGGGVCRAWGRGLSPRRVCDGDTQGPVRKETQK